jgi:tRNA threonylcarbamoyladenosine biosynthesis protein TsaE
MHEYRGRRPIIHLDAYRLHDADEFLQLGADEAFGGPNLVFIEWAQRVAQCLPNERIEIAIRILPDEARQFDVVAVGAQNAALVDQLQSRLCQS